jgi:RNA polymerase sigma-70 factor, ECF subfamily
LDSTEKDIVDKIKNGNIKAYEQIYHLHSGSLLLYANSLVGSFDVAKDIVQDVFVTIWEKRNLLFISASLKSYLYKSVRNACLDFIKHQKVIEKYNDQARNELFEMEVKYNSSVFELSEEIIFDTRLNEINKAIEMLPDQCRKIFKLSRFDGFKNREIAAQLGISIRSVDTQIYRALKTLRGTLRNIITLMIGIISLKFF